MFVHLKVTAFQKIGGVHGFLGITLRAGTLPSLMPKQRNKGKLNLRGEETNSSSLREEL